MVEKVYMEHREVRLQTNNFSKSSGSIGVCLAGCAVMSSMRDIQTPGEKLLSERQWRSRVPCAASLRREATCVMLKGDGRT